MKAQMTAALGCVLAGAAAGCTTNASGDLEATSFGDLSHPLTEVGDPEASVRDACGPAMSPSGPSVLRRRPYLQQLTDHSVQILWTADATLPSASVRVSRPDGSPVADIPAAVEESATPPEGARLWAAAVEGLSPASIYCYDVRSGDVSLRTAGFRTAPNPGARAVRFIAIGDSGDGSGDELAVADQMRKVPFEFAIHMGDLAYNNGTRAEIEKYYFRVYADFLERFAIFPASGNHEYGTEDAAPFREAFSLPTNGGPEGRERWYSFDWGPAHFVALDTERMVQAQADWLDADLTATDRPWKIVFFHKPGFSSGSHGNFGPVQTLDRKSVV